MKEFQAVLAFSPPPSEETLLQLANISRVNHLKLEEQCFSLSEKVHGMTASLAFTRAYAFFQDGHPNDGLTFLEGVLPKNHSDAGWQVAYARYLDLLKDPRAKQAWMDAADAFPNDTQVQWAALGAAAVQQDHEFLGQTIQRLRDQLGEQDLSGRLAQALWLLQGHPTEKQTSEATLILSDVTHASPDLVEPRIILASCMQQLGNISGAVEQLQTVQRAHPEMNSVALSLASLLIVQGEINAARDELERVSQNAPTDTDRQSCAKLFASLGSYDRAVEILEHDSNPSPSAGLMLAQLYLLQNQPAKAETLCRKLIEAPTPSAIQIYAKLLASQGRKAEADAVLAKLDSVEAKPGIREFIRADYLSRFGTPEQAVAQYFAATQASPTEATYWRELTLYCLLAGRIDDLVKYSPDAQRAIPADLGLKAVNDNIPLIRQLATNAAARPLFAALFQNPDDTADIVDALRLVASGMDRNSDLNQLAITSRQLAERHPHILALQELAVQCLAANGQLDDAISFATRAMQTFPTAPEAAQAASSSLAAAGRWDQVLAVAKQWRDRVPVEPAQADLAIAGATMQLGKIDEGLRQLEPYLDRAKKSPDDYPGVVLLYAQGLIATKQTERAAEFLQPLLNSARWRSAWILLGANLPDASARATWLHRVAPLISKDAPDENVQLAIAFQQLASQTHDAALQQSARTLIEPFATRTDIDPELLVRIASIYEQQHDLPNAEKAYRLTLKLKPDEPIALNNLAMILSNSNPQDKEALELIARAVKLAPKVPSFLDTQAVVLGHLKAYDDGVASIDKAIDLDKANPEWKATRIWLLASANKHDVALAEFKQLQANPSFPKISETSRQRLDAVDIR